MPAIDPNAIPAYRPGLFLPEDSAELSSEVGAVLSAEPSVGAADDEVAVADEDRTSVVAGREPDVTPATRVASPVLSAAGCVTGDPEGTCDISVTPAKATIETVESGFAPKSPWTYLLCPLVIFSGKEHERTC